MNTWMTLRGCGLLLAGSASATAFAATPLQPADLNRPGFESTQPWDVADNGTVVGQSDTVGFIYSGGVFSSLAHPNATISTALTGLAADGTLVGGYYDGAIDSPTAHGFIYSGGSFSEFAVPGASWTFVRHISTNGRYITGDWRDSPDSNNGFAFDRLSSTLTLFPAESGLATVVQGVNDLGQVTGSFTRPDPSGGPLISGGFIFDLASGTRTEYLDVDGLPRPRFRDINNLGEIVGFVGLNAFAGTLGDWSVAAAPENFQIAAYGNNNAGAVVGYYIDLDTGLYRGWISSAVPEPAPAALLALGLVALSLRARRRA
jgi:hypothetical protein